MAQPPLEDIAASSGRTHAGLFSAIINSAADAIVAQTLDGVIMSWNPAAERMYGYPAEEIIGRSATILCPPGSQDEIREILARIGGGECGLHRQTVRRRKDRSDFPTSVTLSPVHDQGGTLIGVSSISRDLTGQEQARAAAGPARWAEDLKRASQGVESFIYSVSHDLRAPLRALSGYSTVLLEEYGEVLGEEGRGYAERIAAASEKMATLIEDLLNLSRLSRSEMHLQPVDLGAEAAAIAGELQSRDPGRRVRFVIQDGVRVTADRTLIRTVLRNLLDNAWKFTSGRDDALIEFGTARAPDTPACYYVRDNGVGFDPAYAGRLFTPFQRLHPASEFPGTGIGLAAVRQIVERHAGRVWVEGAAGQGATFYFTLGAEEGT